MTKFQESFSKIVAYRFPDGNQYDADGNLPPELERIIPTGDYDLDYKVFFEKLDAEGISALTDTDLLYEFAARINAERVVTCSEVLGNWRTDGSHLSLRLRLLFPERTDGFFNSAPSNNKIRSRYWHAKKMNGGSMPFELEDVLIRYE